MIGKFPTFTIDKTKDFDELITTGLYPVTAAGNPNKPEGTDSYQGFLLVFRANAAIIQYFITDIGFAYYRVGRLGEYWRDWIGM